MTRTILISLLTALALAAPAAASPGDDAGDLLDWVAEHPRKAGLAVYAGDAPLLRSADRRFALGSTRKVLILGAYARRRPPAGSTPPSASGSTPSSAGTSRAPTAARIRPRSRTGPRAGCSWTAPCRSTRSRGR